MLGLSYCYIFIIVSDPDHTNVRLEFELAKNRLEQSNVQLSLFIPSIDTVPRVTIIRSQKQKGKKQDKAVMKEHTLMRRAKQRCRLMSLRRSFGRFRRRFSSSTPLVSCHLYCSYLLIRSLRLSGSNRWDIHCSASLLFTLISSNLVVVDCKYVCLEKTQTMKCLKQDDY